MRRGEATVNKGVIEEVVHVESNAKPINERNVESVMDKGIVQSENKSLV